MAPRRLALALSVALAATGSLAAHALAFALTQPDAHARAELLERSGHGYADQLALALAIVAVGGVGVLGVAAAGRRGATVRAPRLWPFALVPPAAFAVQETLERGLGPHGLDGGLLTEPAFVAGIALQVPLGIVAWFAARVLTRAALALGRLLRPEPALRPRAGNGHEPPIRLGLPPRRELARAYAGRGPPSTR